MHMQPDVVDYASQRTPRRPMDVLQYAPLVAAVFAAVALLKSTRYELEHLENLRAAQIATLLAVVLSVVGLIVTLARFPRYRRAGRRKLLAAMLLCIAVLVCDALAVWNTATVGAAAVAHVHNPPMQRTGGERIL
jgi:lysylphosphatidylglycerol synthetase-like protein (DUF2156 family)